MSARGVIDPSAFIAPGAVVFGDGRLGRDSSIWYHTVLPEGSDVSPGSLVVGVPARVVRSVDQPLRDRIRWTWEQCVGQARRRKTGAFPALKADM